MTAGVGLRAWLLCTTLTSCAAHRTPPAARAPIGADGDGDPDGDGIPDRRDRCPHEPETWNGVDDDDGCPDKGKLIIRNGRCELGDRVAFEKDGAVILPSSFPLLDAVAAALTGNPEIVLAGRPDPSVPAPLAQARLAAVRAYLVAHGVDAGRITVEASSP